MTDMIAVRSSNIAAVGYDKEAEELEVHFHSGAVYRYENVEVDLLEELVSAPSVGRTFNERVKGGGYPFRQVSPAGGN